MEKKLAGGGKEKVHAVNEPSTEKELKATQNQGVSKSPEPQKEIAPNGEQPIAEHPFVKKSGEDAKEVHLNHVGQKVDKPLSEADSYITPEGKHMVVQMEDDHTVFAGEHGQNAQHYPKSILKTWQKHEPVKVKEEKSDKEDKEDK